MLIAEFFAQYGWFVLYALLGMVCRLSYTGWLCLRYDFARVSANQWLTDNGGRGILHELLLGSVFGGLRAALWILGFTFTVLIKIVATVIAMLIRLESRL